MNNASKVKDMKRRCTGKAKSTGVICKSYTLPNSDRCIHHSTLEKDPLNGKLDVTGKVYRCLGSNQAGNRCKKRIVFQDIQYCSYHQ